MTEYLTEQEQIQQLKNWLKQYGFTILLGVIIAVIIMSGWRYWQRYHTKILVHASAIYDEMLTLRAQNKETDVIVQANKLLTHYAKTPYADMASFMLARQATLQKNYAAAIKNLNWVIENSKVPSSREIARIRAARIYIADKKPTSALDALKKIDDENFLGLVDEVRGDAYLANNDRASARKAYQLALTELPNAEVTRPILEMKFYNLATESKAGV